MFFTQDYQILYLRSFEYNAALIINELKEIIINNGGRVKNNRPGYIVNRTLSEVMRDTADKLEQFEAIATTKPQKLYVNTLRDKLATCKAINNEPILVTTLSYISFVYDGYFYYYEINDNPFFSAHYIKAPLVNGKRSLNYYMENDTKEEWFLDCYLGYDCTNTECREAANLIFNMLVEAPTSEHYKNTKRTRVPNSYDGGYHYENIPEPERWERIDF